MLCVNSLKIQVDLICAVRLLEIYCQFFKVTFYFLFSKYFVNL